ncbi:unnamed protein product [marine sediment metagenome]|uniref:Uncharacterized protein n=1 Tax=marine sediment metagenome TaxID=412755 RepID=X0VWW4_9ZZZZ
MTKIDTPDSPVTMRYCDTRHKSNVRLNVATLIMLGIIMAGGTTIFTLFMGQQSTVAEAANKAVQVVAQETVASERARDHITSEVEHVRADVKEIKSKQSNMMQKQGEINVSLRLLIQKVDDNGKK